MSQTTPRKKRHKTAASASASDAQDRDGFREKLERGIFTAQRASGESVEVPLLYDEDGRLVAVAETDNGKLVRVYRSPKNGWEAYVGSKQVGIFFEPVENCFLWDSEIRGSGLGSLILSLIESRRLAEGKKEQVAIATRHSDARFLRSKGYTPATEQDKARLEKAMSGKRGKNQRLKGHVTLKKEYVVDEDAAGRPTFVKTGGEVVLSRARDGHIKRYLVPERCFES